LLDNSGKTYDISDVDEEKYKDKVFYKERWINEDGLEQRLIITYSIKYRDYQHQIRCNQIDRAIKAVDNSPAKLKYLNQNDYKRFILKTHYTPDGEIAQKEALCIDTKLIAKEEAFDGFYAVCTNLEDDASAIIKINKKRWEIEECFRIMKSEFKARPVHLSRDDRIQAHFMTCFIALIIYRLLEKRLGGKYTCHEILSKLREMNFYHIPGEGYIPTFTRTDFTDDLHEAFGFRTDYQIISTSNMRKIIKITKS
jgi:transposase